MQEADTQYLSAPLKTPLQWPAKYSVLGVQVSATSYAEAVDLLVRAAKERAHAIVDFTPVSVVVEAVNDAVLRSRLNSFDIACPDGQPVRWFLNHFHRTGLEDRVCGTTAMLSLCEAAAHEGIGIYLYGSTPDTVRLLQSKLLNCFPELNIAGAECPPFRALTPEERQQVVDRINQSGAGFVFLGIGSPRQEHLAWELRNDIAAVQLCVGAAYDFIAGTKKRAPEWMQKIGLEWLYRFYKEPARLGKRYLSGNIQFLNLLVRELLASLGLGVFKRRVVARSLRL